MIAFICATVSEPDDQDFIIDVYQNYRHLMLAAAGRYISDPSAREDILQDSIIKLIEHIDTLRGLAPRQMAAYAAATARNMTIDYLRRQGRDSAYWASLEDAGQEIDEQAPTMEELVQISEQQARLTAVWEKLSLADQAVLRGRYILEYSDAELSEQLGCTPANIRVRLTRARRRAFRLLSQAEGGGDAK